jgi:hypothetical protein
MTITEALEKCGYSDIGEDLNKNDEKRRNFIRVLDEMYLRGSKEQFLEFCSLFWDIADDVYNNETTCH